MHFLCTEKMEKLLGMLEVPQQQKVVIDESKLRCFISKISIWDYFRISQNGYKNFPVEQKESMVNRYCNELYQKYYGTGNFVFLFCCFYVCCLQYFP